MLLPLLAAAAAPAAAGLLTAQWFPGSNPTALRNEMRRLVLALMAVRSACAWCMAPNPALVSPPVHSRAPALAAPAELLLCFGGGAAAAVCSRFACVKTPGVPAVVTACFRVQDQCGLRVPDTDEWKEGDEQAEEVKGELLALAASMLHAEVRQAGAGWLACWL